MIFVNTPPNVSTPRESGVTSSRRISVTSPVRTAPWIAAPIATHSIGSIPRSASDEDDLVYLIWRKLCIFKGLHHRLSTSLDDWRHELFELCSGQCKQKILRTSPSRILSYKRKVDLCGYRRRQLYLRLFCRLSDALHCNLVRSKIYASLTLELGNNIVD